MDKNNKNPEFPKKTYTEDLRINNFTAPHLADRHKPNKMRDKPTFSLSTNKLSQEIINKLRIKQSQGKLSEYVCEAISFKDWYDNFPKGFLSELIQRHFELIKYLTRKIGNTRTDC